MDTQIGYSNKDLDTLKSDIKNSETNFGSMTCDLLRTEYFADIGLYGSGSFRKDAIIPAG